MKKIFEKLEKFSVIPSLLVKFTESEKQHQTMRNYAHGEHTYYKRLNVTTGLERMPLDHWVKGPWRPLSRLGEAIGVASTAPAGNEENGDLKGENAEGNEEKVVKAKVVPGGSSLCTMEEATFKYLNREFDPEFDSYAPPKVMLEQTAEKLVRLRRARARLGGPRWETFIGKHLRRDSGRDDASPIGR